MKEFTDNEKVVARNIDKKYKWIARDSDGCLCIYMKKPTKFEGCWEASTGFGEFYAFNHMFKSIKWEDDEPTRIRDIYDPQILDDVERKYLKAVFKPFHEKVNYVVKRGDPAFGEDICSKEYLFAALYGGTFAFPYFSSGKMYSGMEAGRKYKLYELGITYTEDKA